MTALKLHRVLVIDDTPAIHDDFRKVFQRPDAEPSALDATAAELFGDATPRVADATEFVIDSALQGREGAERVRLALEEGNPFSVAFVDMRMPPGWDGLETIQALWKVDPRLQVVICTAHSDRSWHDIRTVLGSSDSLIILKKPFDHSEARQLAHALGQKWALARENEFRLSQLNALLQERTKELRVAEDHFSRAFDANPLPQALIALDPFEILEVNSAFTAQFGLSMAELKQQTPETFLRGIDPVKWRNLIHALNQNQPVDEHPFLFERTPTDVRELRCSARAMAIGQRAGSIWLIRDVTEQGRLEKQFLQAQKMEAVGQLAAGIAHDFNNLLTVIHGYTSMALEDTSQKNPSIKTGLTHVRSAADRAAALTRQLLLFSRRQSARPEPVNVALAFQALGEMLSRLVPERIRVVWQLDSQLPPVLATAAHLEQAIMNLVINARDATAGHGTITVCVKGARFESTDLLRHAKARVGAYVAIAVTDTGTGIAPDVMARIFEPFFTTKESGQGTGLGLCTVYGIADQHGGWIEVESTIGRGSTFTLYFPAVSGMSAHPLPEVGSSREAKEQRGRGEHILIVEDDREVRSAAVAIATRAGYRVTAAEDGFSALTAWHAGNHAFDLVFTDIVMPNGLSGFDVARRLREDKPDLKVIFTTGYSDQLLNGEATCSDSLLFKPYTVPDVVAKLRSTLDAHSSTMTEPSLA